MQTSKYVKGGVIIFLENKRFFTYNHFLKSKFGEKIYKIPMSLAKTCPNRDGKKGVGGCIFCSENGSGDFIANDSSKSLTITEQITKSIQNDNKWNANKYIIYFQSYTNTYIPIDTLKNALDEALSYENVVGISIGTRVDCIDDDVLNLLIEYNKKTFLSIELGLQTSNDATHEIINSKFVTNDYIYTAKRLKDNNIHFATHIIIGLPYETYDDYINTIKTCIIANTDGIKLQLLYILKGTKLEKLYIENNFHILEFDEYIKIIVDIIEILPKNMVIMRLTGDGKKEDLLAPLFSLNKRNILNSIDKELKKRNTFQGYNL